MNEATRREETIIKEGKREEEGGRREWREDRNSKKGKREIEWRKDGGRERSGEKRREDNEHLYKSSSHNSKINSSKISF